MARGKIFTAVDIGSYEVKVAIGYTESVGDEEESIEVLGVGCSLSKGVKRGEVININDTLKSVAQAISDAEEMADTRAENIYASISGTHIKGFSSDGLTAVNGGEIDIRHQKSVIDACKAVKLDNDRELLHTLPQEYIVDDLGGIRDPLGISCYRLKAKVYIVTTGISNSKNLVKCINQNGFHVEDLVVSGIASSCSVLQDDEKELGVLLLDIGAGTTDLVVFKDGAIQHLDVIGVGGNNITSDLATYLKVPISASEEIKKSLSFGSDYYNKKSISIDLIGEQRKVDIQTHVISNIVEDRVKEILKHAKMSVENACNFPISSVVLCGGTSNLRGIDGYAREVFEAPVRVAQIVGNFGGLADLIKDPQYATLMGLMKYAGSNRDLSFKGEVDSEGPLKIFKKIGNWISENF